jgi:hypothetical protein
MSKKFRDILKGGEEQFDPKAWEQMAKRLDQDMPVSKPFYQTTWIYGLSVVAAILVVGGYFFLQNDVVETKPSKKELQQEQVIETSALVEEKAATELNSSAKISETKVNKVATKSEKSEKISENVVSVPEEKVIEAFEYHPKVEQRKVEVMAKEILPVFPELKNTYCLHEKVNIKNTNVGNLLLINEQADRIVILGNSSKTISIEQVGDYSFVYYARSEKRYEQSAFSVPSKKAISIQTNEELIYENGIPYMEVSSKDFNEQATWKSSKGMITEQKETTKVRCFDKGTYTVTLSTKGDHQCVSEEKIELTVKDQFNLLAVNAFVPNDQNPKNRTFMPEALKYRQTGFKMLILDPKDNHLVYQTESADAPWDGIDQLTGKLVDANKLFIWKVDLKQPEPKERGEYSGTVVRL